MNTAIILFLLTTTMPANWQEGPVTYNELLEQAIHNCKNPGSREVDTDILWIIAEAEQRYKVPDSLRGILLAQACGESGFNPKARGDYRNGKPQAIGLFQMWRWWEGVYNIDRRDPYQAADAHMKHIVRILKKIKGRCKHRSVKKWWIAAWVTSIRAPKPGGRCQETPKHWRILKRWHRNIMRDRKLMRESHETGGVPCGC